MLDSSEVSAHGKDGDGDVVRGAGRAVSVEMG